MPNYVYNVLTIKDKELAKKVFAHMKTDENDFDFNQIVKMPDDVYRGDVSLEDRQRLGADKNWYDWSIENWGTKWNACDASYCDNKVYFDTAWSPVPDLINQLMADFDVKDYTYYYAGEEKGADCGYEIMKKGKLTSDFAEDFSEEAYKIRKRVCGD